ncbi:hypothetical protein P3T36_003717 [Kitasatospora sp. MAP12-15]|uniref:hypothetical protein n=1 Tax=unclassified Kitasatospora TaxID=2633591 RepID=UPI0024730A99|nr:hypothetical protein [Kitasatospora sp. MAP12-44]MDH6112305.1 hypothetical protein [Kitasatospora sp. MAP12-44]
MTIRTYRITADGQRVELSPHEDVEGDLPAHDPLNWPACGCPQHRSPEDGTASQLN